MKRRAGGLFGTVVLVAGVCSGQIKQLAGGGSHYVELKLPGGVSSETVFVRYVLDRDDVGGWVHPRVGVSSYVINTNYQGRPATRIRAVLYAPGCAIQTLDLSVSSSNNQQYSFVCRPLPGTGVDGSLRRSDRLYGSEVTLQAKYVARWAQSFLGVGDAVAIPAGEAAHLSTEGRFHLSIPDFSQDPIAGMPDHLGELQIWARDKFSGDIVAQLIPTGAPVIKTRMGGLRIQSEYPANTVFAPCAANPPRVHDEIGFARRPDPEDACDH